jgi:hypothetical protein
MTALILFIKKWIFYALGFMIILMLVFIKGCNHGKTLVHCPIITTNTVIKHDTIIHNIVDSFPYYIQGKTKIVYQTDTIYKNIDTIAVVRDYFSTHITDNRFQDSLVQVDLKTYISENQLKHSVFKYKILRDQSITYTNVDNSTNYSKYLYIYGSAPVINVKYYDVGLFYAFQSGLIGLGYNPYLKSVQVTGGFKLIKFKK